MTRSSKRQSTALMMFAWIIGSVAAACTSTVSDGIDAGDAQDASLNSEDAPNATVSSDSTITINDSGAETSDTSTSDSPDGSPESGDSSSDANVSDAADAGDWTAACGKHGSLFPPGWGADAGSFDGGDGGDGAQMCDLFASYQCVREQACSVQSYLSSYADQADCLARNKLGCMTQLLPVLTLPNSAGSISGFADYVRALSQLSCYDIALGCPVAGAGRGKAPLGAPCTVGGVECASGVCLDVNDAFSFCGVCVEPRNLGDPCADSNNYALPDPVCGYGQCAFDPGAGGGYRCRPPKGAVGEPCDPNLLPTACIGELFCTRGADDAGVCTPRQQRGQPCNDDLDLFCAFDLACNGGTCGDPSPVDAGVNCDFQARLCHDSYCPSKLVGTSTCESYVADGQDCSSGQWCRPPAYCHPTSHTCVTAIPACIGPNATFADVGASGGTLASKDGTTKVIVPAGALATTTHITMSPLTPPGPGGFFGTAYEIGPTGTHFASPVQLTMPYDPSAIGTIDPGELHIAFWTANGWEALAPSIVDTTAHTVTTTTTHFTTFSVIGTPSPMCCGACFGNACATAGGRTSFNGCGCTGTFNQSTGTTLLSSAQSCVNQGKMSSSDCGCYGSAGSVTCYQARGPSCCPSADLVCATFPKKNFGCCPTFKSTTTFCPAGAASILATPTNDMVCLHPGPNNTLDPDAGAYCVAPTCAGGPPCP